MSQRQQLERIMEIDRQIRAGLYPNAARLAVDLEVSKRVIYQDRVFLMDRLGAPIAFDRARRGWFYFDAAYALPAVIMSEGELLAFFLSIEIARRALEPSLEKTFRAAVEKISASLTGPITVDLETIRQHYTFVSPAISITEPQLLTDLYTAIRDLTEVHIRYYTASRDAHSERVIHPYHLYNISGDWYVIAFDSLRGAVRNFLVSRIEAWRLCSSHFERDPNFEISKWMGQAFQAERGGELAGVVIRFDAEQARYIRERRWHPTQQLEETTDGGVILRFMSGGLGEVRRWVMQYGSHAEVLQPAGLRAALIEETERMRWLYQKSRQLVDPEGKDYEGAE